MAIFTRLDLLLFAQRKMPKDRQKSAQDHILDLSPKDEVTQFRQNPSQKKDLKSKVGCAFCVQLSIFPIDSIDKVLSNVKNKEFMEWRERDFALFINNSLEFSIYS